MCELPMSSSQGPPQDCMCGRAEGRQVVKKDITDSGQLESCVNGIEMSC